MPEIVPSKAGKRKRQAAVFGRMRYGLGCHQDHSRFLAKAVDRAVRVLLVDSDIGQAIAPGMPRNDARQHGVKALNSRMYRVDVLTIPRLVERPHPELSGGVAMDDVEWRGPRDDSVVWVYPKLTA